VTVDQYWAQVKIMGFTPVKPPHEGSTICRDRDGLLHAILDPEGMSEQERRAAIALLRIRLGIEEH
jgi:hypothetical protein